MVLGAVDAKWDVLIVPMPGEEICQAIWFVMGDCKNNLSFFELPFSMMMWSLSLEHTGETAHFSAEAAPWACMLAILAWVVNNGDLVEWSVFLFDGAGDLNSCLSLDKGVLGWFTNLEVDGWY